MTLQKRPRKAIHSFPPYFCILNPLPIPMPALALAWDAPIDHLHDGDFFEITRKRREVDTSFYSMDCLGESNNSFK